MDNLILVTATPVVKYPTQVVRLFTNHGSRTTNSRRHDAGPPHCRVSRLLLALRVWDSLTLTESHSVTCLVLYLVSQGPPKGREINSQRPVSWNKYFYKLQERYGDPRRDRIYNLVIFAVDWNLETGRWESAWEYNPIKKSFFLMRIL